MMNMSTSGAWKAIKSKKTILAFIGIFFLATLTISNAGISAYGLPETYDVEIGTHCITEDSAVTVMVRMDEGDWHDTPYTFADLTDSHTFEVNSTDSNDHPFAYWEDDVGLTSPIRTISSGGIYTAVYLEPTETPEITETEVEVDIRPDALNLKSQGKFITVYIELPDGYNVEDIDLSTIELEGVPAISDSKYGFVNNPDSNDGEGIMVKFDRAAVQDAVKSIIGEDDAKFHELELTVTIGFSDGSTFEGSDTIKIISPPAKNSPQSNNSKKGSK